MIALEANKFFLNFRSAPAKTIYPTQTPKPKPLRSLSGKALIHCLQYGLNIWLIFQITNWSVQRRYRYNNHYFAGTGG